MSGRVARQSRAWRIVVRATRWLAREPTAAIYGVWHVPWCGLLIMARAGCAGRVACHVLMLPSVRQVPCMPRMCTHFGCVRGSCSCTGRAGRTRRHGPLHAASGGRRHTAPCRPIPCRMVSNTAWNSTSIGIPHSLHSLVGGGGQGAHSILQASHRKSHPRSSS